MNNDLISRSELKKELSKRLWFVSSSECDAQEIINIIDDAPTVELFCSYLSDGEVRQPCVESPCEHEIPQGKWIYTDFTETKIGHFICSECGWNVAIKTSNFCPNCGARMKKGGEE